MNYIQRLFESAAPAAGAVSGPLVPPITASSPVVAADQRLSVFSDLVAPLAPSASVPELVVPSADAAALPLRAPGPERVADPAARTPEPNPPRPSPGAREPAAPPARPAIEQKAPPRPSPPSPAPPRAISALQRLVEADPLPARNRTPRKAEQQHIGAPPSSAPALPVAGPSERTTSVPIGLPVQAEYNAPKTPAPRYGDSSEISPDQFRPHAAEPRPAPVPAPAMVPVPSLVSARPQAARVPDAPEQRALHPASDAGSSPFARQPHLPAAAPRARPAAGEATRPAPERIIERIREVPVAPPASPKAMTAAAQSVIGPLDARRTGAFRPRQGGF